MSAFFSPLKTIIYVSKYGWLFLLVTSAARAEGVHLKTWPQSWQTQWLRILHYTNDKSLIDNDLFFFSSDGKTDPQSELSASIIAFQHDQPHGTTQIPARCAFPFRFQFLAEKLKWKSTPLCPQVKEFIDSFQARSITLVFASAIPNVPASMFGHTFLRVNSRGEDRVLDWGINYAALVPEDEHFISYIFKGLLGGYDGQFSLEPYFTKLKNYSLGENRDIWEYELDLSEAETRDLLLHLWELNHSGTSQYYFLDENCSFQILTLIEAIKPEWDLTNYTFYVMPGETIKRVLKESVRNVRFRPSLQKQMHAAYSQLSTIEASHFINLLNRPKLQSHHLEKAPVKSLRALALFYHFKNQTEIFDDAERANQNLILRKMSQSPPTTEIEISRSSEPSLGHDSFHWGFQIGRELKPNQVSSDYAELSWASGYHDLLSSESGFPEISQIDLPSIHLRYNTREQILNVERFTLLETTSVLPMSPVEKRLSWRVAAYSYSPKDLECRYCHVTHFEGGLGFATALLSNKSDMIGYLIVLAQNEIGSAHAMGFSLGPALSMGLFWNPSPNWKLLLQLKPSWNLAENSMAVQQRNVNSLELSHTLSRNHEIRTAYHMYSKNFDWLKQSLDEVHFRYNWYY